MANLLMKMPVPYEPLKQNRFIFRFPTNMGMNEWFVISGTRPKMNIGSVEIPFLNTSTYVAGRFLWEAMDITFKDPIGPSASQAIMEWIRTCAESVTGRMGYAASYKKDIYLDMLDPVGVVVQKWLIQGAFVTSADFGSLDYSNEDIADISITIQPDRCVLLF